MGCGESKHAVATQSTITKSKSKSKSRSKNQEQNKPLLSAEIPKDNGNVSANSVADSDVSNVKKDGKIEETEVSKKVDEKVGGVVVPEAKVETEVKAEANEIKSEKKEAAAAASVEVEVVKEKKEEIKNEETLVIEKKEEVKAEAEVNEEAAAAAAPAAVEVVQEKLEEIKTEEPKEEKKDEVKIVDEEEKEKVVPQEAAAIDSSCAKEEGKDEGLKVEESIELDQETKPSTEEKKPLDQNEESVAAAPSTTDVKEN